MESPRRHSDKNSYEMWRKNDVSLAKLLHYLEKSCIFSPNICIVSQYLQSLEKVSLEKSKFFTI